MYYFTVGVYKFHTAIIAWKTKLMIFWWHTYRKEFNIQNKWEHTNELKSSIQTSTHTSLNEKNSLFVVEKLSNHASKRSRWLPLETNVKICLNSTGIPYNFCVEIKAVETRSYTFGNIFLFLIINLTENTSNEMKCCNLKFNLYLHQQ